MVISEMISLLQKALPEHGDIRVVVGYKQKDVKLDDSSGLQYRESEYGEPVLQL
jgi:hypothetical protein